MLSKMSVGTKVAGGFAILLLIFAISSGVTYYSVRQAATISATVERTSKNTLLAAKMEDALNRRIGGIRGYLLTGKDKELASYQTAKQDLADRTEELRNLVKSDEGKRLLAKIQELAQQYTAAVDRVAELRTANHLPEATEMYFGPQVAQLRSQLHDAIAEQESHEEQKHEKAQEELRVVEARVQSMVVGLGIVGLGLGAAIAFFLGRWFSASVLQILSFANELRQNNLTVADLRVSSADEIGQTFEALNTMKNNLGEMIRAIATAAAQVGGASEELNSTSQQITANSAETSAQADVVSKAAQTVSQNLQTVAHRRRRDERQH